MPSEACAAQRIYSGPEVKELHVQGISCQDPSFLRAKNLHNAAAAILDNAHAAKMLGDTATGDPPTHMLDALIVGGGIPGISIAMSLARTLHTAVVFDSDIYETPQSHRPRTASSQQSSEQFLNTARSLILTRYNSARFSDAKIDRVERIDDEEGGTAFLAVDVDGREWRGRKIVLAMGISLQFPTLAGYRECWNKGIFDNLIRREVHDGYTSIGILAIDGDATFSRAYQFAVQAQHITERVTIYTNANRTLGSEIERALPSQGIEMNQRRIAKLEINEESSKVKMIWHDGSSVAESFLVQKPRLELNAPFAEQLGVEITEAGTIRTHFPFNETSVPGVFAAGDCASPSRIGTQSVVMGAFVAGGIQMQIRGYSAIDSTFNTLQL